MLTMTQSINLILKGINDLKEDIDKTLRSTSEYEIEYVTSQIITIFFNAFIKISKDIINSWPGCS
jgi:hypothetical protein